MVLGIYGSSGIGIRVMETVKQINAISERWGEIVFIDDFTSDTTRNGYKLFPFAKIIEIFSPEVLEISIAVGEPADREMIYDRIREKQYKLATIIHPSVHISESTKILAGTTICALSFISSNIKIGNNVFVQPKAFIGHDCIVGDHSVISPCAAIAGRCSIGQSTFLGMGATVKERTKIGSNSIVGLGSVVVTDIPDNVVAAGNPARVIKNNEGKRVFK